MPVTIKTVESRKDLRAFVKFPLKLYKDCPYYVPGIYMDELTTLDMSKNPMGSMPRRRSIWLTMRKERSSAV